MLSVLTFRTPEEAVEKANNTPYGLSAGVWTEKGSRILWMAERLRAGVVWANTFNRFDPASPFGGYKESGFGREGGRARPRAVPEVRRVSQDRPSARPTSCSSAARSRAPSRAARTRPRARTSPAPRARTSATRSGPRAARFPKWAERDGVQPRPGALPPRRDAGGARRRPRRASARGRAEVERAVDRVVWYAGWADKLPQVLGASNPVAGPYFNFTVPEPTGVVAVLAPAEPPLLGLVSRVAPALVGGNAVVAVASETHPLAAVELAEASRRPTCPAASSTSSPATATSSAPVLAVAHGRQRDRRHGRRRRRRRARAARRRERQARRARRASEQSPWEIAAFLELKTVWHPSGVV